MLGNNIRVRACKSCSEYIPIDTNNSSYLEKEKRFNQEHKGHFVFTCQISDIENYKLVKV